MGALGLRDDAVPDAAVGLGVPLGQVCVACLDRRLGPAADSAAHFLEGGAATSPALRLAIEGSLLPVFAVLLALAAAAQFSNHCTVQVIDSQTVGAGLGMLVQAAAVAAAQGLSIAEIERKIRVAIPHIYVLFCIPELMYLAAAGQMDRSQAMVGEILSMLPVFTLEEGRLVPSEKVRTPRHLFEAFQDFMAEFERPAHIALVHGSNHNSLRIRPLRQYLQELFPQTPFSEHALQPQLTALFGPQSIGLFVSEIDE